MSFDLFLFWNLIFVTFVFTFLSFALSYPKGRHTHAVYLFICLASLSFGSACALVFIRNL